MANELTNQDKLIIVEDHIRSLQMSKFNLELTKIEENAVKSPDTVVLSSVQSQIDDYAAKLVALEAQKTSLSS